MTERKIDINLRIAGVALTLPVELSEEALLRDAAKGINQVWNGWRQRYPDKSGTEIMAMVCLLFAKGFLAMKEQNEAADRLLEQMEQTLDSLLEATGKP